MSKRETRSVRLSFPFYLYFNQLFSPDTYVRYLNPFDFWRRYKINHLETCYQRDVVQHLECCYQLKRRSPRLTSREKIDCKVDLSNESFEQLSFKTISIIQPSIKLKYRTVVYQTEKFLVISITHYTLNTSLSKLGNYKNTLGVK